MQMLINYSIWSFMVFPQDYLMGTLIFLSEVSFKQHKAWNLGSRPGSYQIM